MKRLMREQVGLTVAEVVVAIGLFLIVSMGVYAVMSSSVKGSSAVRSHVRIAEEARFGLSRMIRYTRQADEVVCFDAATCPTSTRYRIRVDFDTDGVYESPNEAGDYEDLFFEYSSIDRRIVLRAGSEVETLVEGAEAIPGRDIFTYSSNRLEFDTDGNGTPTWQELDQNGAIGNSNGALDGTELGYISEMSVAFRVFDGSKSTNFFSDAQLRNRR